MKITHVLRTLAAGGGLYLVMAACGAADQASTPQPDGGSLASGVVDAMVDQLTSPVKDAKAEPLPPDINTESCDKTATQTIGATTVNLLVAKHAYPGKTANELSALRVVMNNTAHGQVSSDGLTFEKSQGTAYLSDGYALVVCGSADTPPLNASSVVFILP